MSIGGDEETAEKRTQQAGRYVEAVLASRSAAAAVLDTATGDIYM